MRQSRNPIVSPLASFAVLLGLISAGGNPAAAQEVPAASGLQVFATSYLWLAGIDTVTKTPLPRAPEVNSEVSALQLLGHLNAVPFMGSIELRDGPFSLFGDALHVPVGTNITTHNVFYQGGKAALTTNTGTAILFYHALEEPVQSLDLGGGFRAWGFSTLLTLNGGLLPTASVPRAAGWADPLIAARYHRDFGDGFGASVYGDVGGFNVGAQIDWQVIGTIDYAPKPWLTLRLGYRSLNFNYRASDNIGFNVHMKGPILAGTFRF